MTRRSRLQAQRMAEKKRADQLNKMKKEQTKAFEDAKKAQKDYEKARITNQKEQAKLYIESRVAQVQLQNEQLEQQIKSLEHILLDAYSVDPYIDIQTLKQTSTLPPFDPGPLALAEAPPQPQMYAMPELTGMQKFLPGAKEKHAQEVAKRQEVYRAHVTEHATRDRARQYALAQARANYERQLAEEWQRIAVQHAEVDVFQREFLAGSLQAVIDYFKMVLDSSIYPEGFPQQTKLAYIPESRQLVVEYDLPSFEIVPQIGAYKYVKAKDSVTETPRPAAQRRNLYTSVIAQVTLRTLYELFKADRLGQLDMIVFNGYVDSVDRGTGRSMRTCLVTVRTSCDIFTALNLSQVDPQSCLAVLNASFSKSPAELAPVRPVLEFKMVDPRFIEEADVLSGLDQRPNLMELTPSEFESLITNLFQKMGLETRQTQASRDGGVDCVAFDPRPIFGGKVVIQAKRYKNTVGVSAVRDLYGTMQNEGASKGILVTTSGYGKASYEFADGKPLELLSGSNLLYLLKEHAEIEAKIQMPEDWKDPLTDI